MHTRAHTTIYATPFSISENCKPLAVRLFVVRCAACTCSLALLTILSDISGLQFAMAPCLAGREIYTRCYQYIHLPFDTILSTHHAGYQPTIWRNLRQQNLSPVYCSNSGPHPRHSSAKCGWRHENDLMGWEMSTRWHMMSEKQLPIPYKGEITPEETDR